MKVNGYNIIASIRVWQEWEVEIDPQNGKPYATIMRSEQGEVDANEVEEWSFEGGDYYIDDYTFSTLEECIEFVKTLEPFEEG